MLEFKNHLLQMKKVKPLTVNAYLSALIRFNEYLMETARQGEMVIRSKDYMKVQSELSNPWDGEDEDVDCLFISIMKGQENFRERNYAIMLVMAYAGLRVSEVVNLDIEDVCISTFEIFVRNGKGQKYRKVYMNNKIIAAIESYLNVRPKTDCTALFVSRTGRRLTRRRVQQVISGHSDTLTPHKLRHYFCSQSQSVAGYSIMETCQQAGHSSPQTTMRYCHPKKKDILEKANRM